MTRDKTVETREEARTQVDRAFFNDKKARKAKAVMEVFLPLSEVDQTSSVLEVGCGAGRLSRVIADHLAPTGSYVGLDVRAELIRELEARVPPAYPNVHFVEADVQNERYRPRGRLSGAEYEFPFSDEEFDFVFLYSVFTHMMPAEVERYLQEIVRVLKPHGRCVSSYFLLDPVSVAQIEKGVASHLFVHALGQHRVVSLEKPEANVAYDEAYIRDLYRRSGLSIIEPVLYGGWSRREGANRGVPQDRIAATKD